MIDLLKNALAFPIYFSTEIVPMLWDASLGTIGDLLDAIDNTQKVIALIPIAAGILFWILKHITKKDN